MNIYAPLHQNIQPDLIKIEVSLHFQIPSIKIIGLVSHDVQEAKERIFAAFEASKIDFPKRKIIINLPPASSAKEGTHFDLPMAIALFLKSEKKEFQKKLSLVASGELSLDGHVKGAGKLYRTLMGCIYKNIQYLILSTEEQDNYHNAFTIIQENMPQLKHFPKVIFIKHLSEIKNLNKLISNNSVLPPVKKPSVSPIEQVQPPDKQMQRIITLSLIGVHHLLILGPKGVGKSNCLKWAESCFFPWSNIALIDNNLIQELKYNKIDHFNTYKTGSLIRPYSLTGSCTKNSITPGAYSLSHGKLLITDELLEWHKDSLETLREPLENKNIVINRLGNTIKLPSEFILLATGNLCPCGGMPQNLISSNYKTVYVCSCNINKQKSYLSKISGSVYERIDLIYFLWNQKLSHLKKEAKPHSALEIKKYIQDCRDHLIKKYGNLPGLLSTVECEKFLKSNLHVSTQLDEILNQHPKLNNLRNKHKILKIALTLSVMERQNEVNNANLYEALSYRLTP